MGPEVAALMDRDPFSLQRFVTAQEGVYASALAELTAGRKRSHWMWFILPQLKGLGSSPLAQAYGISGLDEARTYLAHPMLGTRLRDCVAAILAHRGTPVAVILGDVDALKFRSCLTLFAAAAPSEVLFTDALAAFHGGQADGRTQDLLRSHRA